jgi:hypothetical protein
MAAVGHLIYHLVHIFTKTGIRAERSEAQQLISLIKLLGMYAQPGVILACGYLLV